MKRSIALMSLLIILAFSSFAQDGNRRLENRFGLGVQVLGPVFMGSLQADYFLNHNFNVEIGIGQPAVYIGGKYYFGSADKDKKWAPYLGVTYRLPGVLNDDESGYYIPFGIQYMSKGGFTIAPEYGFIKSSTHTTPLWGSLRIGYHF